MVHVVATADHRQNTAAGSERITINAIIAQAPKKVAGAEAMGPISDITTAGQGIAVQLTKPEELITRMLALSFGAKYEKDLRRFVNAYREITRKAGKTR